MCECEANLIRINQILRLQLTKSICLLSSHLFALRVMLYSLRPIQSGILYIPCFVLALVKNTMYRKRHTCCESNNCEFHINHKNPNAETLYRIDKNRVAINSIASNPLCCLVPWNISRYAVYCDPCDGVAKRLCKKDIVWVVKNPNEHGFELHTKQIIAKYEGWVAFFRKIIDLIDTGKII